MLKHPRPESHAHQPPQATSPLTNRMDRVKAHLLPHQAAESPIPKRAEQRSLNPLPAVKPNSLPSSLNLRRKLSENHQHPVIPLQSSRTAVLPLLDAPVYRFHHLDRRLPRTKMPLLRKPLLRRMSRKPRNELLLTQRQPRYGRTCLRRSYRLSVRCTTNLVVTIVSSPCVSGISIMMRHSCKDPWTKQGKAILAVLVVSDARSSKF